MDRFRTRGIEYFGSTWSAFFHLPSIFWWHVSDAWLLALAWTGVGLAAFTALAGASLPLLLALWIIYQSIVNMGQVFYGYGWETLLLETGFLSLFLCPAGIGFYPLRKPPPARAVFWLLRWLCFRLMFGAGMIKLRGDPCWIHLTCMDYHYETQPLPNPLSPWLYHLPHAWHRVESAGSLFVEVIIPFLVFGPRRLRILAGALMIFFQGILILSGNLSWLNYATIAICFACFDDGVWRRVLPRPVFRWLAGRKTTDSAPPETAATGRVRVWIVRALLAVMAVLSVRPAWNLVSPNQEMNASFDPLHLVNAYGAFGSVGRERNEIILSGTREDPASDTAHWREYEFKCKPGSVNRRPCVVAPYQLRLDWQMWFAAMESPEDNPWLFRLVWQLLQNRPGALSLIAGNPFPHKPPRSIKGDLYRYHFAGRDAPPGVWWRRQKLGVYFPPLYLDHGDLKAADQTSP